MGKGDKKTRKGKIFMGSYGKSRPSTHSIIMNVPVSAKKSVKKTEISVEADSTPTEKKVTTAKKSAEKKTVSANKTEGKKSKEE